MDEQEQNLGNQNGEGEFPLPVEVMFAEEDEEARAGSSSTNGAIGNPVDNTCDPGVRQHRWCNPDIGSSSSDEEMDGHSPIFDTDGDSDEDSACFSPPPRLVEEGNRDGLSDSRFGIKVVPLTQLRTLPTTHSNVVLKTVEEAEKQTTKPEPHSRSRPEYLEKCIVCEKPADFVCKGCYRFAYCSEEHQMEDWIRHRSDCVHYGLQRSPSLLQRGPFMVSVDIKEGHKSSYKLKSTTVTAPNDKILEEKPFLICPWPRPKMRQTERHLAPGLLIRNLSCFGCGKTLCFNWMRCEDCNLFLCSKDCLYLSQHRNLECKIIQQLTPQNRNKLDCRLNLNQLHEAEVYREYLYADIMIIRLVLKFSKMRESMSPEQFANECAKLDLIWKSISLPTINGTNERRKALYGNLQLFLGFSYKLMRGNESLLWKLFTIIDMNGFVFDLPFRRFKVLCLVLGMASHSCTPNCHAYLHEPGVEKMDIDQIEQDPNELTVIIKSGKNIDKGVNITFSYVPLTFGTVERRSLLMNTYNINCLCSRCIDVTECGTFTTNIKCPSCRAAMLVPGNVPVNKRNLELRQFVKPNWECRGNNIVTRSSASASAFRRIGRLCPSVNHDEAMRKLNGMESMLVKFSTDDISTVHEMLLATRGERGHYYQSGVLKLCEDIIRGTYFPLPDITADDLKEFSDPALLAIVVAKGLYREFMRVTNPAFNFEGFPVANLELAENELYGRESGRALVDTVNANSSVSQPRVRGCLLQAMSLYL